MLKISAFYLDKQKRVVPKKNIRHVANRDFKKQNYVPCQNIELKS